MNERESLILGSLLHDIGKFSHRAEEKLRLEYDKNLRTFYCPTDYGYSHLLYSGQFVKDIFKDKESPIENLVLSHHKPDSFKGDKKLPKIIQLADYLSSGERRERDESEKGVVKKEPIISIFSQLLIKDEKNGEIYKPEELYNRPVKIDNNLEKLVPVEKKDAITDNYNFKKLWEEFKDECQYLNYPSNFEKIFTQIFSLLEKYTLFIPSSAYTDKPEISLFHHLKLTCAIATCLYDLNIAKETLDKLIEELKKIFEKRRTGELIEEIDYGKLNRKDFILLKGDISGIQDFIYSVSSEHALKGLRGRSFYLQLISEIIAYKILDEFNLTKANLIYLGGGNFIILLPNLSDAEKRLEKLTEEIDKVIFKAHQGKLGFLISYIKFPYWNFIENFGDLLSELGRKLAIEKRKKFKYLISENLFKPYPEKVEKEMGGCEICGREIEKKDKCELCESFEKLAIEIKKENVIMEIKKVNKKEIKEEVNKWDEIFEGLGYKISFEKSIGGIKIYLNNSDFLKVNCDAFRYEAIYSPEGTLEDIAKKAEGIERWGALRMDVDNLGLIFGSGFIDEEGKDITTISKYSMLSYTFSLFFSLGIRNIVEKEYKEKCCVVYSGGDDLFIIAPWSDLPEIAEEIWRNFRKYVCNHEKITISGGIYIAPSKKFPVYQAAKKAGEEEEKAKKGEKNKITFFEPIKWDEEFVKIKEVKNKLYELLKEDGKPKVSRAILTILYGGYKEKELKERGKIPFVRIWRIFYALKRFMERHKDYENDIDKIRETFITDFNIQPKLNVAVRWAELLTRKGG